MGNNFIAGIDEAGRGPVIGPMVVACVILDEQGSKLFKDFGVKDSKLLSPKRRKELFEFVIDESIYTSTRVLWPDLIDYYVENKSLNVLESDTIASILNELPFDCSVVVDSPAGPEQFKAMILDKTNNCEKFNIKCTFKADRDYVCVSAASVLAKVIRDDIIETLKISLGDFGSGYPSDIKTINYLKSSEANTEIIRKTWKTYSQLSLPM